ncbi:MAG: tetratricopeptide repeat protein [Bacteroidales bacterium]
MIKFFLALSFSLFVLTISEAQRYKFGDYMQFGRDELSKGRYHEAIGHMNNAIRHRPASFEGWYFRGIAKYFLDDLYGAEQDLTESMKFDPFNSEIYHLRAIVRSRQYNFGGALTDYTKAIELNPKNSLFYVNRSRVHLFIQDYDSCLADCDRALKLRYNESDVYLLRGSAQAGLKKYNEALLDLNHAILIDPVNTTSYIQRGSIWTELEKPDSAMADFNRAIQITPHDADALLSRALLLLDIKDTTAAMKDLNRVIENSPFNSYAYYNRTMIMLSKNETEMALDDLDKLITLNPDNIVIYLFRGKIRYATGQLKAAMEDFTKAIEIYPDFADAYYERSRVKEELNDFSGAERDLRMAHMVGEFQFSSNEEMRLEQQMYLKRLLAFRDDISSTKRTVSGAYPEKIELLPSFQQVMFSGDLAGIRFFEAKSSKGYSENIISLTNNPGAIDIHMTSTALDQMNEKTSTSSELESFYLQTATLHSNLQDYSRALEYFELAVRHNPQSIMAWLGKANSQLSLIQMINSQVEPQYHLHLADDFTSAYNTSHNYPGDHNYRQVLQDLNRVLDIDPEFTFGWFNRSLVKSYMGDYWGAVSDLSTLLRIDQEFAEAWFNKGLLLILLDLKTVGCRDMSRAGELGMDKAYEVLVRYCNQ